jgi:hypothetical protein
VHDDHGGDDAEDNDDSTNKEVQVRDLTNHLMKMMMIKVMIISD